MRRSTLIASTALGTVGAVALVWFAGSHGESFGQRVLARARADLGVTEANDPSRVAQMLANYGILQPANWCAAAVGTWIREAARAIGAAPPIPGSANAKATMVQLQMAGTWIDASVLRANPARIAPGMIVVWSRGPIEGPFGHIGVVSVGARGGAAFRSVEGNAGATGGAVVEGGHWISDPNLLGMGVLA